MCFCASNILHFGFFAALNPGILVYGVTAQKLECSLGLFVSRSMNELPLPRKAEYADYIYFLLNICHSIHSWVQQQDKADTESTNGPNMNTIFDSCLRSTKSETRGVFNVGNKWLEWLLSAKHQKDAWNCGVFASLNWSLFVSLQGDQPSLWTEIDMLDGLNQKIVNYFWTTRKIHKIV
jgi:hypothetical protein